MAKLTLKEFQEVSEFLNTSPNVTMWSFLEAVILCFIRCCSLVLIDLRLHGLVATFWLSVFSSIFASVS